MTQACGAPNPDGAPLIGRNRLNIPCARRQYHTGPHRDGIGRIWPQAAMPSEAKSEARIAFEVEMDELEALRLKREEWNHIDRQLTELHRRQFEGDSSELTRQRIGRLEALQACLCGDAYALAQEQPARPRHRA